MSQKETRRLAVVWFADIVGYTELSARDEEAALKGGA
jgi:class 3 adenylate cyclase